MRIVLLNPPNRFRLSKTSRWPEHTKSGTLYYPFWLAYATGVLMETVHEPLLIDAIANRWDFSSTLEKIIKFNPDLLVIETSTPSINDDIKFVEEFKQKSKSKVVLVGSHVSALPESTLNTFKSIDFIARGEYDYTILNLVNILEKNGKIKNVLGLSYKKNKKIIHNPNRPLIKNLDALPFVSKVYKKFLNFNDYRYALAKHPMIQIWSSRGCPNFCSFCLYPQTLMGRMFRPRSPENFVDELEWIDKNIPEIKEIFFEDDTFTVDKQRVLKICDLIEERNLDITWSANVRVDVPYEILKRMKKVGCRMIIVGYESGDQKILNNIKKGTTLQLAEEFTKNSKQIGLKIFGCFMIGLPGETKESIQKTFQFAKKLNPDMVFFQQAVPFPGTEFYNWCKKNGYLVTEDFNKWLDHNGKLSFLVNYPNLTANDVREVREKLMIKFYTSPKYLWQTFTHNLELDEIQRLLIAIKKYLSYLILKR